MLRLSVAPADSEFTFTLEISLDMDCGLNGSYGSYSDRPNMTIEVVENPVQPSYDSRV